MSELKRILLRTPHGLTTRVVCRWASDSTVVDCVAQDLKIQRERVTIVCDDFLGPFNSINSPKPNSE